MRARRIAALLLCMAPAGSAIAQPTVNGLFHGDGDNGLYSPYATSQNGSVLYSYYHAAGNRLYVALVVSHSVNDLVCSPQSNSAYTSSAVPTWGPHRSCKRASDSEFATFTLACAPGSQNSWTWQQALGCPQVAGPPQRNWVSNPTCGPSSPAAAWPPGVATSATSSFVANVNTYQAAAPATRAWNLYTFGTDVENWKSPFVASSPNNVTQVPGYPTYSTSNGAGLFYQWEWSMVYEWSVSLGPTGANCGNEPIVFISGLSHHSPGKAGENDPFPPSNQILSDWGDLPNSYRTLGSNSGARHYLKATGPYLGADILPEADGQPTADASGDGFEEDGVVANVTTNWTPLSVQTITITVSRAPVGGAVVGAWFDWNGDGDFADAGEFFQFPGLTTGTHTRQIVVGAAFDWQTDELYARFRLFSSPTAAPSGGPALLSQSDSSGLATDGEVEDYRYQPASLPVTLNAFASEGSAGGEVTVRWQTASETDNAGFELWGQVGGKWRPLTSLIPSRQGSSALPQSYRVLVTAPAGLTALRLVDYDTRGRSERFGPFRLGERRGEFQAVETVDWSRPRAEHERALRGRGFADTAGPETASADAAARWKRLRRTPVDEPAARHGASTLAIPAAAKHGGAPTIEVATGPLTHVAVTATGIQRVSYEALLAAGLDLAGVHANEIAVTWRGAPVARWIDGPPKFGPGAAIEFLGRAPEGDDALYIDASLYQVSLDRRRARRAGTIGQGNPSGFSPWHLAETRVDRPRLFHHQSPTGDPWVDRIVLVPRNGTPTVTLDLEVGGPVLDAAGSLVVSLGTISDLPDLRDGGGQVIPEHNVEVWLRRPDGTPVYLASSSASGQVDWRIEADLAPGVLQPGLNRIELRFATQYTFSLVVVDRFGVLYPTSYRGPVLDFAPDPGAGGYRIEGFATPAVVAYAESADGSLTRLAPRIVPSGGAFVAEIRSIDAQRLWVAETPGVPAVFTTEAPAGDLLTSAGDLVVIAGSGFVGSQALDDYLAQRADLDPVVVDVEDVYNAVGFGMALPSAIRDYLAVRDAVRPFTHVQLVGTDCYDRRNYISSCLSLVPLPTARVGQSFYSPSQNRLVDLDGDGVGDKAVAQFSVRDQAELATIVAKAAAWDTGDLSGGGSALLIAEETDGLHDFEDQIERLEAQLAWGDVDLLRMADHPDVRTARAALRDSLAAGRAVTTFSGHSSPTVWAFRSLLTAAGVDELTNAGLPTIVVPLACETTYDVSPNANVLGHRLLYAGDRGALAISGAVSLANLSQNELMANHVLAGLKRGLTLGQAVLAGRQAVGPALQELQDNWLTQGDVAVALAP